MSDAKELLPVGYYGIRDWREEQYTESFDGEYRTCWLTFCRSVVEKQIVGYELHDGEKRELVVVGPVREKRIIKGQSLADCRTKAEKELP